MDRVRQARLDTADPMVEVFSAFELLNMREGGEDKRSDRTQLLNDDQVAQLATDCGDHATLKWLNFRTAVLLANVDADIYCNGDAFNQPGILELEAIDPTHRPSVRLVRALLPLHEVDRSKKGSTPGKPASAGKFQGLKRVREFYRKQYEAWLKEGEAAERGKGKGKEKGSVLHRQHLAIARRWRQPPQTLNGRDRSGWLAWAWRCRLGWPSALSHRLPRAMADCALRFCGRGCRGDGRAAVRCEFEELP
jgi:hypothetical protein